MKTNIQNRVISAKRGAAKARAWYAGLLCVLAAALLPSCEHKDLCYQHPHTAEVRVVFNWTYAPDANPAGMCLFFYPKDGQGSVSRFDLSGSEGGQIEVETGAYRVLCYNNDTEGVLFSGMDNFDTHAGYTREGSIFEPIYGTGISSARVDDSDERVAICPDMMWGCTAADVEIGETGVQIITLHPEELVCTYTYEIRNVKNLKYATQMCASLSGMAPSLAFTTGGMGTDRVTLPFEAKSDGESTITGRFHTFGNNGADAAVHELLLYVWMMDGAKYYYRFDVTRQVDEAEDRRHVHLIIDQVEFPQPITNGSGFSPSIDEWISEEEDIKM